MKKLLLLFFIFISLWAQSQTSVYYPFPDSNAVWCTTTQWNDGMCDHTDNSSTYFGNDTLINGNTYHTLSRSGFQYSFQCSSGGHYYYPFIAAIRQDTVLHKVYMYDSTINADTIFYDFNLQIGDTLDRHNINWSSDPDFHIISSIDSILLNGQYRKRYNYTGSFTTGCADSSIIEGIGCISGLMVPPSTCFEYYTSLTGFRQNGIALYPDTNAYCNVIAGIDNKTEDKLLHMYPNPVNDKLNITVNNNQISEINIYDITSRNIFRQSFINSISINTEQLAKGIYVYTFTNKNGVITKGKFVKD